MLFLADAYCLTPHPAQDLLAQGDAVVVYDSTEGIDRSAPHFAIFVRILKAVHLCRAIELQLDITVQVCSYSIDSPMDFALIRADEKKIISNTQISHPIERGHEVVKSLEIEVEEPRACVVPELKPFTPRLACVQESANQTQPLLVFDDTPQP